MSGRNGDSGEGAAFPHGPIPNVLPVSLPQPGELPGGGLRIIGLNVGGHAWVRLVYTPPGALYVMDLPAGITNDEATKVGQAIIDSASKARTGLVIPGAG